MSESPDHLPDLARLSAIPVERIRYFAEADSSIVDHMGTGVLFLIAWWSGPAVENFRTLSHVIGNLDPDGQLEFVVIDVDGAEGLKEVLKSFWGYIGGYGETAWIKSGRVISTSERGSRPECFEPNTRALLQLVEQDRVHLA